MLRRLKTMPPKLLLLHLSSSRGRYHLMYYRELVHQMAGISKTLSRSSRICVRHIINASYGVTAGQMAKLFGEMTEGRDTKPEENNTGESISPRIIPSPKGPGLDNQTAVGRLISIISHMWVAPLCFQAPGRSPEPQLPLHSLDI